MELSVILELLRDNPGSYFIAGLVMGFLLRGYIANYRGGKRPGRYEALGRKNGEKRTNVKATADEPCFEWADAAVKTLTARQNDVILDQPGKEI